MREGIIIGEFQRIGQAIKSLNEMLVSTMQHMQLGFSGSALHEEALKSLLMKKGIVLMMCILKSLYMVCCFIVETTYG